MAAITLPRISRPRRAKKPRTAMVVMYDGEGHAGNFILPEPEALAHLPVQCRYEGANGRPRLLWALAGFATVFMFLSAILYEQFYMAGIPPAVAFGIAPWPAIPFGLIGWMVAPLPQPIYVVSRLHLAAKVEGEERVGLMPQSPDLAIRTRPSDEKRVDPKTKKALDYIRNRLILAASYRFDSLKMDDERISLTTPKSSVEKIALGMLILLPVALLIIIFLLFTVSAGQQAGSTVVTTNILGTPVAVNGTPISQMTQEEREKFFPSVTPGTNQANSPTNSPNPPTPTPSPRARP